MLWTAFFVCFVFAGMNKLSNARTIVLSVFTLMVALLGNVFRATLLFMLEVVKDRTDVAEPTWLHAGVGLVLFAFAVVTIGMLAIRLHRREQSRRKRLHNGNSGMVAVGILLAFLAPHMVPGVARAATISTTLDFPKTYNGRTLTPLPLSQQEQVFATNFPGRIGKFSDGQNQLIMRWVSAPTRQLHPSEDCFRGLGYKIESKPNVHDDATNTTWGAFEATGQDGTKLIIRERITDASNNCFTDVSAWYWAATLGKSHGPWLATTIAQLN
jgi:exosortase/archaeosortase family protein